MPVSSPEFSVQATSSSQVEKAIRHALAGRGWRVLSHKPGQFIAQHSRAGRHTAEIDIRYSSSNVSIDYRDSKGLMYGKDAVTGQAVIHKTYNNWLHYLERDIHSNLVIL